MMPLRFPAWSAAAIAFAVTLGLVPAVRAFCIRRQIFDAPGPLKIHTQPVPRLGGAAIFAAIFAAVMFAMPVKPRAIGAFLAALTLVWLAGFLDDLRNLSPAVRVAAQVAAGVLIWTGGWRIPILGNSFLGLIAVCTAVAAASNSINLLDGIDGLATGTCAIIAAAYLALPRGALSPLGYIVAASMLGACLGFLPANWPIANLFLGDEGSTLLGFAIAFLSIDSCRAPSPTVSAIAFPFLVAAVPLLDATLAAIRRVRHRASPLRGDRLHIYDLLRRRGWPILRILAALYTVTAALSAIALLAIRHPSANSWILAAVPVTVLLVSSLRLGSLRSDTPSHTHTAASNIPVEENFRPTRTPSF